MVLIVNFLKFVFLSLFLFISFFVLLESLFMPLFLPMYQHVALAIILSLISILLHIKKKTFIAFMIISLSLLVPAGANYSGYCIRQNKFVSPEEKIQEAVTRIHKWTNEKRFWAIGEEKIELIPYSSAEEIIKNNPDCCTYKQTDRTIYGEWSIAEGRIQYETQYKKEDGSIETTELKGGANYGNCGVTEIWDFINFGND